MAKPLVAIVGRPNVGKSTFFNRVAGRRISIVEDRPGVTRDRLYADCDWAGKLFTLVDTGGLELIGSGEISGRVREQAETAMDTADVILFFVDYKTGLAHEDFDLADMLRRRNKPVLTVLNKVDTYSPEAAAEFYSLGLGEVYPISSEGGLGIGDLLDDVCAYFKNIVTEDPYADSVKIAVVGRPNVGKSSLANKILGFERSIVTDIAGTTRDSLDTPFTFEGENYVIIDTAGMRRKRSVDDSVESYSALRALAAIDRADVCIIMLDACEEITEQDVRIAGYVHERGKPSVVALNKWDAVEKDTYTILEFNKKLAEALKFMDYFQSISISAKTGQRNEQLLRLCKKVYANASARVTTGLLNDVISDAVSVTEPPSRSGRRFKIYYCAQVDTNPPIFALHVNDAGLLHFSYKRYLENALRKAFPLEGTPIRFSIKDKSDKVPDKAGRN